MSQERSNGMLGWLRNQGSIIPSLDIQDIETYGRGKQFFCCCLLFVVCCLLFVVCIPQLTPLSQRCFSTVWTGIIATTEIRTRTLVSAVPRPLLIRSSVAIKNSPHARVVYKDLLNRYFNRDQTEKIAIAIFVLEQVTLGVDSDFYYYLNILPTGLSHMPIFWDATDMKALETTRSWDLVMQQRRALLQEYQVLSKKIPAFASAYTFQDYCWARGIIMTRAFRVTFDFGTPKLHKNNGEHNGDLDGEHDGGHNGELDGELNRTFRGRGNKDSSHHLPLSHLMGGEALPRTNVQTTCRNDVLVLSPLADMLNHRMTPNTAWRYSSSLDSFTLYATQTIKKGTPIYDSYGIKTNDALLRTFGFVDRDYMSLRTMKHRQAEIILAMEEYDLRSYSSSSSSPSSSSSSSSSALSNTCGKINDLDSLLLRSKGAMSIKTFTLSHTLDEHLQQLLDYTTSILGTREAMVALMIRAEKEFQWDDVVACEMNLCDFWDIGDTAEGTDTTERTDTAEGTDTTEGTDTAEGTDMEEATGEQEVGSGGGCWEAYMPDYEHCRGYRSVGYSCVGGWCAAMDPGGTPDACAVRKGTTYVVDRATGRCTQAERVLPDVFAAEWKHVLASTALTDNQRNGLLLRVEERAVYRLLQRIATQALFTTQPTQPTMAGMDEEGEVGVEGEVGEEGEHVNEEDMEDVAWAEVVANEEAREGGVPVEEGENEENEEDEEDEPSQSLLHDLVAFLDDNDAVEHQQLPHEEEEVREGMGAEQEEDEHQNNLSSSTTATSSTTALSPLLENTVVVEISGLAGPIIRLALPDPGRSTNGAVSMDVYPALQQSLRDMEQRFVTDDGAVSVPRIGERVLSRCCDTDLYFSGTLISSMDDGSHVVQFHALDPVVAQWSNWMGPIATQPVYYSLSPLDIIRVTPKHVYRNTPMAWLPLDADNDGEYDAGVKDVVHGQEVFVLWKNNKHRMYFDGNVVLVKRGASGESGESDASDESEKGIMIAVQYNDGDYEENVKLSQILIRVD